MAVSSSNATAAASRPVRRSINLQQMRGYFDQQRKEKAAANVAASQIAGLMQTREQLAVANKLRVADAIASRLSKVDTSLTALANPLLTPSQRQGLVSNIATQLAQADQFGRNTNFSDGGVSQGAFGLFIKPETTIHIETPLAFNNSAATYGQARIQFSAQPTNGQTLRIHGVNFTASTSSNTGTNFRIGATLDETVTNLVARMNAQTTGNATRATYAKDGTGVVVTARTAGEFGEDIVIDRSASTARNAFTVTGDAIGGDRFTLQGGTQGAGAGGDVRVRSTGPAANALLATAANTVPTVRLNFATATNVANGQYVRLDNGAGGTFTFTFRTAASAANPLDVQLGSTLEQSLQNMAQAINGYAGRSGTDMDFTLRQVQFRQDGNALVGEARSGSNPIDGGLAAVEISENTAGTLTSATFSTASATGILTDGISNAAFTGTIGGFSARYVSANRVELSTTIGNATYRGTVASTLPTALTAVRMLSAEGGYFDFQLAAGAGSAVANQTAANSYASRLNAALSTLEFSQTRTLTLDNATALGGASIALRATSFTGTATLQEATVTSAAENTGQAQIRLKINDEVFTSQGSIGATLGAGETLRLASSTNPARVIELRNTASAVSLATAQDAQAYKVKLEQAFGYTHRVEPPEQKIVYGAEAAGVNPAYLRPVTSSWLMGDAQLGLTAGTQAADVALLQKAKTRLGEIWQYLNTQYNTLSQQQTYDRYGSISRWVGATRPTILA